MLEYDKKQLKNFDPFREDRSLELFGRTYFSLSPAENTILDNYIADYNHPEWRETITPRGDILEVDQFGHVRDAVTKEPLEIHQQVHKGMIWYPYISYKGEDGKWVPPVMVHRLVAIAFVPNPDNKPEVNHIDGRKDNNWRGNLEWVTSSENRVHALKTGLVKPPSGEEHWNNKYTDAQIRMVCELLMNPNITHGEISKRTGVSEPIITMVYHKDLRKDICGPYNFPKQNTVYTGQGQMINDMWLKGHTRKEIVEAVLKAYPDHDPERLKNHVSTAKRDLKKKGLLPK